MKLSPETVTIIKNFAGINQNIWINEGYVLSTVTASRTTVAYATVSEAFDKSFGIYDLGKFLGVLSLFTDPEITFDESFMKIGEGKNVVKFVYAEQEALIVPPNKKLNFVDPDITVEVTQDNIARMLKAADVLGATHISLHGDGKKVDLVAHSVDTNTGEAVDNSDEYRITIGKSTAKYRMDLKRENIKMLPGDYKMEVVSTKRISKFTHETLSLEYYMACESTSQK